MPFVTTWQVFSPYFNFLKYLALAPVELLNEEEDEEIKESRDKDLNCLKSNEAEESHEDSPKVANSRKEKNYSYCQMILLSIGISDLIFVVCTLTYGIFSGKELRTVIIGTCGYLCFCGQNCLCFTVFLYKGKSIKNLVKEWQRVEKLIIDQPGECHKNSLTNTEEIVASHRFIFRAVVLFYCIAVSGSVILICMLSNVSYGGTIFIYYVIDPAREITWVFVVSILLQGFLTCVIILSISQFEVFIFSFACSMRTCLKVLIDKSKEEELKTLIKKSRVTNVFKPINTQVDKRLVALSQLVSSVEKYYLLEKLVEDFNKIFSWTFFVFKASLILTLCMTAYVVLRHKSPFNLEIHMLFYFSAMSLFIRVCSLLPSMGSVYNHSVVFKQSWLHLLPFLSFSSTWHEKKLHSCVPFGFRSGNFYHIRPFTILTFFSITTSYLIVLLQL